MRKENHSIRNKIIIWAVGFALLLAVAVASVSFILSARYIRSTQEQAALTNIHIIGDDIDRDITTVTTFSNWICLDSTIGNYLQNIDNQMLSDPQAGKKLSLSAWNHLNNEFLIVGVRSRVGRVLIATSNGDYFLQSLASGDAQNAGNAPSTVMSSSFFEEMIASNYGTLVGPVDDPFNSNSAYKVIPIIRPIYSSSSSQMLGWVYMDIPETIINNTLRSFALSEDDAIYLTFNDDSTYIYDGRHLVKELIPEGTISYTLPETGWILSYLPSENAYTSRFRSYFKLILLIFIVILFAGIFLSIILQRTITRPVGLLINRLSQIGSGDFSRDEKIEWNNELGEIGRGINALSENVSFLMDKRLQDEKTKHDLEYQVLQSQINPHFLYNTLNTIKWMATIQGSEGISEMATALSRLMKNISKSSEDIIPIADEFSLVNDYFTIMKYRYGGTIELEYQTENESLLQQKINRFSLQPIVENAIFHGIEPKGSAGKIVIHTYLKDQKVIIDVTDNGVGMSQEAINSVLSGESQATTEFFKQIGVGNVKERIKYTFGEEYGLSIRSELGKYTTMSFSLPYIEYK